MPAENWDGVRDGSIKPVACVQLSAESVMSRVSPASLVGDEDCLFLNVFTPKVK